MEFCLLGSLAVRAGGVPVLVRPGKQRVLLAALLLNANHVVPTDELAEMLWGATQPPSAGVTIRNYVKRLRGALADASRARIGTQGRGYLIMVGADELDVTRFEARLRTAQNAAGVGEWSEAARQATEALALWRGEPLADVESETLIQREVPRLTELRLQALETRIHAEVCLGGQPGVIAELRRLTALHPVREQLQSLLMLALYRCGRQAEALAAYQQARQVLVSELGTEPGPALQDLHVRILRADPALAAPQPEVHGTPSRAAAIPRQLPAAIPHFAGRAAELERLTQQLDGAAMAEGTVVITAIGGLAGVGKTTLALQWAHQVTGRFPDGQLYVNLRGFDPAAAPMTPEEALRGFLEALQVASGKIPVTTQAQAGLYRTLLAEKNMLIVLDNAGDEQQVRPLLPGGPGCLVIITSRNPLAGLSTADGAETVSLGLLSEPEARELLARRLGAGRLAAEPVAVTELLTLCARLPLALAIAAARAATHPDVPLAAVAAELRDPGGRLDALDTGEAATSMRAVLSWSFRGLGAAAARMFRLLGLHPGPDVTIPAAASLAGVTTERSCELVHELARAGLLSERTAQRFAFHDLLRAYAAEQARTHGGEQEQRAALTGLLDYYLAAASAAMDAVYPADKPQRPCPSAPAVPVPELPTAASGQAWLNAERAGLIAMTGYAAVNGWPGHAIRLAATVFQYLDTSGYLPDARAISASALWAARQTGDLAQEAESLRNLGYTDLQKSDYQQAAKNLVSALALYQEMGDRGGQARALRSLGIVDWLRGRPPQAISQFRRALAIFRETGDRIDECPTLNNLGQVLKLQGHYSQAASYHRRALAISREVGNRRSEANALNNLGMTLCRQGRYRQAHDQIGQALAIYRDLGSPMGEAATLDNLGHLYHEQARYEEAAGYHRQALATFREMGDVSNEALALIGLGDALSRLGLPEQARGRHDNALTLARMIGAQYPQARAHDGLARSYHATGDYDQACRHWQHALTLYTGLGAPEAAEVSARLSALPPL
jgi:DNA-binding SARP family transcriptional activator/tetratricopeptide (TPR) repeat protein